MGEVYRARQTDLDRIVGLKLVLPERCDDPQFLARFRREAIAMGRLNHPSIVAIHEFGELAGRPFLSMEYIDGISLRTKLRRGLIPRPEALEIIQQLCDAISYADAARLLGGEQRLRFASGFVHSASTHESMESIKSAAISALGARAAQAALDEGAALPIEKLVELAEAD